MGATLTAELTIETIPDADVEVVRVQGREAISELFELEVEVRTRARLRLDVDEALGSDARLVIHVDGVEQRRLSGMVRSLDEVFEPEAKERAYRVRLVPRAHVARLLKTYDVFADDMTVPDLIGRKLEALDLPHDLGRLLGTYTPRDFYMQYGETDWSFLCRHAEHLGIAFVVRQTDAGDAIHFVDDNTLFAEAPEPIPMAGYEGVPGITALEARTETVPAMHVVMDYNDLTPDIDLTCTSESDVGFAGGTVEWGPFVTTVAEGEALARVRREQSDTRRRVYRGRANLLQLEAGLRIRIEGLEEERELLLTAVQHRGRFEGLGDDEAAATYEVEFEAIDASLPYRPALRTPVPRVQGLLSALVEPDAYGEVGAHARIDEHGRYRVKFRFDTTELDGRASCPVRMAQPSTGPGYGMHFPLRPGVEVAVGFLHGDPDRPVIVGSLHNASTPAHVREQNAIQNVIRTQSGITFTLEDA